MMDTDINEQIITPIETRDNLKLVKGKDDPTTFLPLSQKIGGNNNKKVQVNKNDSLGKKSS